MSSSPADPADVAGRTSPPRRTWSLSLRLALLTAVSSFAILTVISVQMYLLLVNHLTERNKSYLRDEVETLAQMARLRGFSETLAMEMHIEPVGEEYVTHYVRLLNNKGEPVLATPNMESLLPRELFPPAEKRGKVGEAVGARARDGSSFILTTVRLDGEKEQNGWVLQVALDVTNVEKILDGYRNKLAITLAIGFLLCVGAGFAIARRETRPIREITEKARVITASSLDERLSGEDWPQELNSLAAAMNGMLDRLQDSFRRLDISVANLTHKLRTPLTVLRGEAELALGRERSAEELREVIESSLAEYERVSTLIDNIVLIAQAESGRLHPVRIKIKARAEIDKLLDFYGPLAEEKEIAIALEGDATLSADPTLFRKAIAKLISNALTYTPSGGRAVISVRQQEDRSVEIMVTDNGCGIAEEEIPRVFDRFYRVYSTRYTDPHGSGLGLPIVKTIMELHNGVIEVRSRVGQGTTAVLIFPPA
jgi:two-component system, OmpR family, heavy metal sensor histidine kinase CusS